MSIEKIFNNKNIEQFPIIIIIGATGCGKTKLSLEISKYFDLKYNFKTEIISADSMQIYKNLDIATNKATEQERKLVPHHLIDIIDPFQQFTVLDFQKNALKLIKSIISRGNFPLIVGGTNYYIESILWDTLVGNQFDNDNIDDDEFLIISNDDQTNSLDESIEKIETVNDLLKLSKITYRGVRSITDEKLYEFLKEIDLKSAENLHKSDRRKVIRCLQVYQQTGGLKMSKLLAEQRNKLGSSRHGGPLRFKNAIIFWLDCEREILNKRLDDRVDEMIKQGLIDELIKFHQNYNQKRLEQKINGNSLLPDYTEGIFQSIGLKEFHDYLLLTESERLTYDGQLKLGNGILNLKQRTRSYVSKQLKWIRRRFLVNEKIRNVPNIYRLDTSQPEQWTDEVLNKSLLIIENIFKILTSTSTNDTTINVEKIWKEILNPLSIKIENNHDIDEDEIISRKFFCETCQITCSGLKSFNEHLNSKKHRYHLKKQQAENNQGTINTHITMFE